MNRRKIICLLMSLALIILITGCEENVPAPETIEPSESSANLPDEETPKGEDGIDIDLTLLSSTMVYSEVYNMMYYPENYLGKKVKMSGMYTMIHDEVTDKYYHGCIIMDATACCAQGIEFDLTDDYVYPDDYPKEGDTICVVGTFETYMEGENKYCTLRNAQIDRS